MNDEREETAGADAQIDEHAARFLGVVNLLADAAVQALQQGETDSARGLVDSVESL